MKGMWVQYFLFGEHGKYSKRWMFVKRKEGRKKKIHITISSFFLEKTQDFCVWVNSGPQRTQDLTDWWPATFLIPRQSPRPPPQQSRWEFASFNPETGCRSQLRHLPAVHSCNAQLSAQLP